jgi:hypothetical protein
MSTILKYVAVMLFTLGLILSAGCIGYQAWMMREDPQWPPKYIEVFYLALAITTIGAWTLALLEIRNVIATSLTQAEAGPAKPAAGSKKVDVRTSYLDVHDR